MIIVRKLNTKTFTGRDLVERLYSESWELEQREYGLVKKILRKTVRPILNSMISNKQKSMDKLNKSIKEDYVSDKRPEIMQSLGRKAKELGVKVLKGKKKDNLGSDSIESSKRLIKEREKTGKKAKIRLSRENNWEIDAKNIKSIERNRLINSNKPQQRKLGKAAINNKFVINHKGSQASLAHEIGHVIDDSSKGVSKEFISRVKPKGISGAIKEYKNASKTVEKERSASNNAIKLLKDAGVKGKELKRAEKELNESLKTYKLSRSKKVLEALNRGLDDLTPSEKERLKINRENKIENLKRSIKSVFKKK